MHCFTFFPVNPQHKLTYFGHSYNLQGMHTSVHMLKGACHAQAYFLDWFKHNGQTMHRY